MIKTVAIVVFGLALASAAQALPPRQCRNQTALSRKPVWVVGRVWSWSTVPAWPEPRSATRAAVRDGMVASVLTIISAL